MYNERESPQTELILPQSSLIFVLPKRHIVGLRDAPPIDCVDPIPSVISPSCFITLDSLWYALASAPPMNNQVKLNREHAWTSAAPQCNA